uniref:Uncharacterized protein n=1 Tax=Rhizophora mucronata TaxID=61149 RepID=A0A2P2ITD2_RHIMU
MPNRKPHRRLLALRSKLGQQPPKLGGLRNRVRPRLTWREGRPDLRSDRLLRPRPGKPNSGHPPVRRHSERSPLDSVPEQHAHKAQA